MVGRQRQRVKGKSILRTKLPSNIRELRNSLPQKAVSSKQHFNFNSNSHKEHNKMNTHDAMYECDSPSPRPRNLWHCTNPHGRRRSLHELGEDSSNARARPLHWCSEATSRFPRRASDSMQYPYPPTQHGNFQQAPYHNHDACHPPGPWYAKGTFPGLASDEKEQVARERQLPSRPSSSEGSSSGKPSPAKYGCPYCGKGFSRPSSLKVSPRTYSQAL